MLIRARWWFIQRRKYFLMIAVFCGLFLFLGQKVHRTKTLLSQQRTNALEATTVMPENEARGEPEPIQGYHRAQALAELCKNLSSAGNKKLLNPTLAVCRTSSPTPVTYCPLCKIASTFWQRVFTMVKLNSRANISIHYKTPFDVPIPQALSGVDKCKTNTRLLSFPRNSKIFLFLFVRSPYSMLFSAYCDKVLKPTPYYIDMFGKPAIKRLRGDLHTNGSDVTFEEFVNQVVYQYRKFKKLDCHVANFRSCQPCSLNYTYVGKLETFKQDAREILSQMGLQKTIDIFKKNLTALKANDAIDDVTKGVFANREELRKSYMHFSDAVKRIWRVLQIRVILGHSGLPLSNERAEVIDRDDFIKIIHQARMRANPKETKLQSNLAFIEAYRSLPSKLMAEIRDIYKEEFLLFQFDETPNNLYGQEYKIETRGFLNMSNIHEDIQPRGSFV